MDRQDRDYYNRNEYSSGYRGGAGYNRNDEHYHSARNLKNEFERDFQRERREWDDDRDQYRQNHSYDQGGSRNNDNFRRDRLGYRNYSDSQRNDWDRERNYSNNFSRDRDRFSDYQDDFRGDQGMYGGDRDRNQQTRSNIDEGNIRRGYGISGYDGTSDRFNTLNSAQNRGGSDDQVYYSGDRDGYRSSRFGGGTGNSFPSSNRGVPDTTYGLGNFRDNYGTGLGSSYGGKNYGGGTGYMTGHRGGSFGNHSYGTSAGNYGGYGSMGGGTYGGRSGVNGNTSHNSNRGTTELSGL